MAKCPECEAEINHLNYAKTETYAAEVEVIDGKLCYLSEDNELDSSGFECPECSEIVCRDEQSALEFLTQPKITEEQETPKIPL